MKDDRTTGVTEARFALTLVICVLVAIGYILLLRLGGGSDHSPIEVRPDVLAQPTLPKEDPNRPRVLPVDEPGASGSSPQEIATRPEPTTGSNPNSGSAGSNSSNDAQRR
jgi:hypothetical protein